MFSRAVKIFTLQGFDIRLDPSWLLIATLITWTLSRQYFPQVVEGQPETTYLLMALFAMLAFFGSLILHELAHSVVARFYGVKIKSITLFLFGGVAELEAEPEEASVEFWVALAGPAMSVALAAMFWFLARVGQFAGLGAPITEVLSYLGLINLVLALFNLVPAFPLDGGRVLRAYLWHRSGDVLSATKIAANSGSTFAYVLMALGLLLLFGGQTASGLWQIFIGIFLLLAARSGYEQQLMKTSLRGKTVQSLMSKNPVTCHPDITLSMLVNRIMLVQRSSFVPVVEDGVLLGIVDSHVLSLIDQENWSNTKVGDVFIATDTNNCVPPDMPVQDLLNRITATGQRKYLVAVGHTLLGVVTLSDLLGYINLFNTLHTKERTIWPNARSG
ncbi:site-2 protease family protein [Roseovarius sp.]|uniref:site-2 protease family protein n=1 Tax=Roseovarius sp. TaxID=1486281 RepID=UPI00262BBE6E|nr:site-2 protease family protein [Roseovarius sp.]